ncbi:MAG: amidohydrolase family protein [Acidimicrobiia bacterium]
MRSMLALFLSLTLLVFACSGEPTVSPELSGTTTGAESTTTSETSAPETPEAPSLEPSPATVVFVGGTVITMDPDEPGAEAVAIDGNRIVAVGGRALVDRYVGPRTQVIDLEGRTLMPGLVDAHSHFFAEGVNSGVGIEIQDTEILPRGITTLGELATSEDLLTSLMGYEEQGQLAVRVSAYLMYNDGCGLEQGDWWKAYPMTRVPGEMLRIGGIKVFSDGGSCNVPAVSYTYSNGSSGDLYYDVPEMESIMEEVQDAGFQVAIHALGDRAIATVNEAMAAVAEPGNPLRHRIEHNAVVSTDLYRAYQDSGAVAVIFGAYQTCLFTENNNSFAFRTPDEFISWEWPWRALIDNNPETAFAWHGDFPIFQERLGGHLVGFVTRRQSGENGVCEPTPDMTSGNITVEEALHAMTVGSAYALGREDEVGSIVVDKYADLIVLNQNPLTVSPEELGNTEVLMTMIEGGIRFCATVLESLCGESESPEPSVPPDAAECAPDSVSLAAGRAVDTSAAAPDSPAEYAVDGDPDTHWGSADDAEQWIEIDLGASTRVTCVRLLTDQYPAGRTVHRVNGGDHPDPGRELATIEGSTDDVQWLQIEGDWEFRYLRVTTLVSPSWVSWREIVVR